MDLRQIRYFVAACEEGSLSGAAARLHCTPSGVSQQMSALEARLGTGLLERTRRGVNPTAAGWRFYNRCLAVLTSVSEAEMELEDFSAGLSGSVSAGAAERQMLWSRRRPAAPSISMSASLPSRRSGSRQRR